MGFFLQKLIRHYVYFPNNVIFPNTLVVVITWHVMVPKHGKLEKRDFITCNVVTRVCHCNRCVVNFPSPTGYVIGKWGKLGEM
jgi:hypothetical protein